MIPGLRWCVIAWVVLVSLMLGPVLMAILPAMLSGEAVDPAELLSGKSGRMDDHGLGRECRHDFHVDRLGPRAENGARVIGRLTGGMSASADASTRASLRCMVAGSWS